MYWNVYKNLAALECGHGPTLYPDISRCERILHARLQHQLPSSKIPLPTPVRNTSYYLGVDYKFITSEKGIELLTT